MSESTIIDSLKRTFVTTATLSGYELLALETDGTVSIATATSSQTEVGVLAGEYSIDAGDLAQVRLLNGGGSAFMKLSATATIGDTIYPATTGKVSSATFTDSPTIGYALQSGAADDVIEILLA